MPPEDMEFSDPTTADSQFEWEQAQGYPEGIHEMILSEDEDGSQTRFLRFEPGAEGDELLEHDFYEEVYIIEGGLIDKRLGEAFTRGMYAYRTPGMEHGPYVAPVGCTTIEFRYYK